jgi:uncharacterized protein YcbK (DUF882 family)
MSKALSEHFSTDEFGGPVTAELVAALERLRAARGGRPLRIVSGYRSEARNRAVGGARLSQHLTGRAADIPEGYATVHDAEHAGFTGIGSKGKWAVHVDVRPGGPARWTYD